MKNLNLKCIKHLIYILIWVVFFKFNLCAQQWQWAKGFGGSGYETGTDVVVYNDGNIYAVGYFTSNQITFENFVLSNSGPLYNSYLVKLDDNGNLIWARKIGNESSDYVRSVTCDIYGNIYIAGNFTSQSIILGNDTLVNSGQGDAFFAKYDTEGNVIWARSIKNPSQGCVQDYDVAYDITTDNEGNLYVTGVFKSTSIIYQNILLVNKGGTDVFVFKIDTNGNAIWGKSFGGTNYDYSSSIAADILGNVFITGTFHSSQLYIDDDTLSNNSVKNIYIVKFDINGNLIWCNSATTYYSVESCGITTDNNGNSYICGSYYGNSPLSFNNINLNAPNGWDIFIAKFSSNGNPIWLKKISGNNDEYAYSIKANSNNELIITGAFNSPIINIEQNQLLNSAENYYDILVVKYDENGIVEWTKNAGGTKDDNGISLSTFGNSIYLTGEFYSPIINFGTLSLNNSGGCDLFIVKISDILKIEKQNYFEELFKIYPNPVDKYLRIEVNTSYLTSENDIKIYISNIFDKELYEFYIKEDDNLVILEDFKPGIYFIKLYSKNKFLGIKKFFKL